MSFEKFAHRFKTLFGFDLKEEHDKFAHLKIKTLDEKAVIPTYAHDGDIGMDLTAISVEYDAEHDTYVYHTGIAVETDRNYGVFLYPRSSNRKTDCYLANHVGVVDSYQYRGELMLCFKNRTSFADRIDHLSLLSRFEQLLKNIRNSNSLKKLQENMRETVNEEINLNPLDFAPYEVGDRIAQMVVVKLPLVKVLLAKVLSRTARGTGGFGSSGK